MCIIGFDEADSAQRILILYNNSTRGTINSTLDMAFVDFTYRSINIDRATFVTLTGLI